MKHARALITNGWQSLLWRHDTVQARAAFVDARRGLVHALRDGLPVAQHFQALVLLADVTAWLGDKAGLAQSVAGLVDLLPQSPPTVANVLLRRMVERWGTLDEAERGATKLNANMAFEQVQEVLILIAARRARIATAPFSDADILALRAHLAAAGVAIWRDGQILRRDRDDNHRTIEALQNLDLPVESCLAFLARLGVRTDADLLIDLEPFTVYDVTRHWAAVELLHRQRLQNRSAVSESVRLEKSGDQ